MLPCPRCATPAPAEVLSCPHCNTSLQPAGAEVRALPLFLLSLGLSLAGCGDKDDTGDTGQIAQPEYGTAALEDSDDAQ